MIRGGLVISSARAQFDQTGPRIVENVNQWAEILRNAMSPCSHELFLFGQSAPGDDNNRSVPLVWEHYIRSKELKNVHDNHSCVEICC